MADTALDSIPIPEDPNADRGPLVLYVVWILTGLSTLVVAARLYTKIRKTHRLYYDDGIMTIALILGLAHAATTTWAVSCGFGHHYMSLNALDRKHSLKAGIITMAWGILSPMAARIGFCVTMLFLTATDPRVKKWPIWVFITLQALFNIASVIAFYAQCGTHLSVYWTPSEALTLQKYCWDPTIQTKLGYFVGAFNCLTDAFLTILPAVLIEHTRLSLKKKLGLAFLLCLSVVALVASIVKTYEAVALSSLIDYTYDLAPYAIWMSVELNVVIIVSSIPFLRPLFRKRRRAVEQQAPTQWHTTSFTSAFSKKGMRTTTHHSLSSQDNIMPYHPHYEMADGITVTREVTVEYEPSDAPFVHAALVGLVQGQIAKPRVAQR
ncbi:hypothetical protein LTR37_019645 [Vermiconidia calcicola]|uniref:Uncharacterized protein n=1 Tax=Vermiconidia calcicola TaxID=1690605 RepID=A0ACC3MDN7_9PEZI|nr:hypothetical protein LTR37_019645 [Vermiconidia calcicola]